MCAYELPVAFAGRDVLLLSAMSLPARISANMRYWLGVKGFDQTELAIKSRLSQGFISMLLDGKRGVAIEKLDNIARAFDIDVVELTMDPDRRTLTDTGTNDMPSILGRPVSSKVGHVHSNINHSVLDTPATVETIINQVLARVGIALVTAAATAPAESDEQSGGAVPRSGDT